MASRQARALQQVRWSLPPFMKVTGFPSGMGLEHASQISIATPGQATRPLDYFKGDTRSGSPPAWASPVASRDPGRPPDGAMHHELVPFKRARRAVASRGSPDTAARPTATPPPDDSTSLQPRDQRYRPDTGGT